MYTYLPVSRFLLISIALLFVWPALAQPQPAPQLDVAAFDRDRVLKAAKQYLLEAPVTITASSSPRSAGGLHDFFSEADYWWPDPQNPEGPYIQRDGMSNPGNFVEHRRSLMRLSVQVPALAAAWRLTKDDRYADSRGPPSAGLVHRRTNTDEPESEVLSGHQRSGDRTRHRHNRYHSSGRGSTRSRGTARLTGFNRLRPERHQALVHRVPKMDDDRQVWN